MHNDGRMKRLCSCIIKAHLSLSIAHLKVKHLKSLRSRRKKLCNGKQRSSKCTKSATISVQKRFYAQTFVSSVKSCFVQLLFRWLLLQYFPFKVASFFDVAHFPFNPQYEATLQSWRWLHFCSSKRWKWASKENICCVNNFFVLIFVFAFDR